MFSIWCDYPEKDDFSISDIEPMPEELYQVMEEHYEKLEELEDETILA